jgi:S-DNA-T family DNA segregation ATPase FtsK/SpoIIIE
MKLINPTQHKRLNEASGFVLLSVGLFLWLSLLSYEAQDPSWNTATGPLRPLNLTGYAGSYVADFLLQAFGLTAFLFPILALLLAWKWLRSEMFEAPAAKLIGSVAFLLGMGVLFSFGPDWRLFSGTIRLGGALGLVAADSLKASFNTAGAILLDLTVIILSVYLVSSFTMRKFADFLAPLVRIAAGMRDRWVTWRGGAAERRREKLAARLQKAREAQARRSAVVDAKPRPQGKSAVETEPELGPELAPTFEPELEAETEAPTAPEIPICTLADAPPWDAPAPAPAAAPSVVKSNLPHPVFRLPATSLLNEPAARSEFDEQELKNIAARVKSKFEEFNVLGSVVQINPGPVVTTFEFKPDAGIKYSRMTTLTEDLCLGLQAESILIERIPGKPTVGIEVPNTKRDVISLRQILESEEFQNSASHLTISLGKDINGRIKVAALDSMPHLLIAGSTGAGKSVMINSMIMSILYKSTPDEVRMIMIDPKRLELGLYEGIPHLMTPVITDPKKATNALRNAVLEMERRLRLLAEQGARSIDQYNKKIRKMREQPRNLFEDEEATAQEELRPLPYVLILIDELADLMMLEGRNVEESVTRLAQMARAVGMHLVLATQRPSVDVITGLIKANFPARISFRVATRVDSRTILDIMGAEHLLGKGDMLFLPPGTSRLIRVHGAFVTEAEINDVVEFWKRQAQPEYDQTFLIAPPAEDGEAEAEEGSAEQDPMYEEALRVVLEMGKASTSTLQRRLRLGYGRAARILDMMHRDGIIGPPDGSKPREVLKRPDWLSEMEMK